MIATQNERFIQQRYDDFAVGNIPAVLAALAEEHPLRVLGHGPLSDDYHGPTDMIGFPVRFI